MSDTSTQAPPVRKSDSGGGNFFTHKLGPLPMWGWIAVVIGTVIVYKIIKDRESGSSSTASGTVGASDNAASLFGTEGFSTNSAGQVVDNATGDILGGGGVGASTSGTGTTTAQTWFSSAQQALFNLGYDNGTVDQALQDYAAGNPLPQNEYSIIEAAIRLTGNPPSGIALPSLQAPTVTAPTAPPAAPTPAPAPTNTSNENAPLSASLIAEMTGNGEHVISSVFDSADNTMVYLTNKGGIYTVGSGFFGSAFSLGSEFVGTPTQVRLNSMGGYTIVNNQGQTYNFAGPGSGADYASSTNGKNPT